MDVCYETLVLVYFDAGDKKTIEKKDRSNHWASQAAREGE